MEFIPEEKRGASKVPFYEQARAADGWAGQGTSKSRKALLAEMQQAIARLGGIITQMEFGKYKLSEFEYREGYLIRYSMEGAGDGAPLRGEIKVAALPCRNSSHSEASVRMLLYMLRDAFRASWFMQQLSPGYSALMPFLLVDGKKTVTELWGEQTSLRNLLPDRTAEFIDAVIVEQK